LLEIDNVFKLHISPKVFGIPPSNSLSKRVRLVREFILLKPSGIKP
jgi:hypothetical protein